MSENIILSPVPLDVLLSQLTTIVRTELRAKQEEDLSHTELSKKEAAKLLNVSEATIDNWSRPDVGILTKYRRGRITYYLYSEVMQSKTSFKKYTRKAA